MKLTDWLIIAAVLVAGYFVYQRSSAPRVAPAMPYGPPPQYPAPVPVVYPPTPPAQAPPPGPTDAQEAAGIIAAINPAGLISSIGGLFSSSGSSDDSGE